MTTKAIKSRNVKQGHTVILPSGTTIAVGEVRWRTPGVPIGADENDYHRVILIDEGGTWNEMRPDARLRRVVAGV